MARNVSCEQKERKAALFSMQGALLVAFAKRWKYLPALVVFCVAFTVRLVYNLTAARDYTPRFDAALYNFIAQNLLNKHCYCIYGTQPAVSRAPLWPWMMAGIYSITGQQNFFARLFYCFLGSGTCLLVYAFANALFGRRIALVAGVIAALYTGLFLYDGWLYTESLYTFCVTGFAYTLFRVQSPASPAASGVKQSAPSAIWQAINRQRWPILCGLFIGAAALTRPNGLSLLGVLVLWAVILIWSNSMPIRQVLRNTLLISLIALLMVAPWTYRNYLTTHQFVPVETGIGEVLLGAYNDVVVAGDPAVRGYWRPPAGALNHDLPGYTPQTDKQDTDKALAWIGSHLNEMPYLLGLHFLNMWQPYTYAHGLPIEEFPDRRSSQFILALIPVESIPIFLLAALGLIATWKRFKSALLVVYLVIAATIAQNMVFYSTMRFRAPIEPLLVLLAGAAIWWMLPWWKRAVGRKLFLRGEL
jgi:4-amino-4-deoxy-L-arabinose transferase-like glycosyltransferase